MQSAVKSRIASFEAASSKGGAPSPSRPIGSNSPVRRSNNFSPVRQVNSYNHQPRDTPTPQKQFGVGAQEPRQRLQHPEEDPIPTHDQQQSPPVRRRSRETKSRSSLFKNPGAGNISLNTNTGSETSDRSDGYKNNNIYGSNSTSSQQNIETMSTTSAASENRKSRLRSQQMSRDNTNSAVVATPATNLSEKRRQRRILQSQRRSRLSSRTTSSSQDTATNETEGGEAAAGMGRPTTPTRTPIDNSSSSRVPDSPGMSSLGSNGDTVGSRFSKLSRLQRKPLTIQQRQSSTATSRTSGAHSVATALVRNTAGSLGVSSPKHPGSPTMDRKPSGLALKNRRHRQESPKNSSPSQRSVQSMKSPSRTSSNRGVSNYGGGMDQQQLNASLEAPTDDDATLTSVHRIMEGSNSKHNNRGGGGSGGGGGGNTPSQNHSYETLQASQNQSVRQNVKYENQNSYDSSVGPSWKLNRGAGSRNAMWKEDEKSDKLGYGANGSRVLRTDYSSDYDMDDVSKTDRSRHSASASHANEYFNNSRYHNANNLNKSNNNNNNMGSSTNRRIDDDERTFDYGDRDDDSNGGTSYRRRIEAEQRRARMAASSNMNDLNNNNYSRNNNSEQGIHRQGSTNGNNGEPMLLSRDDMEHLTMNDSPTLRLSAGVAAVATVGLCVGGPVGLLAGVAAGGLGFGFMQIPEEERKKIQAKAEKAVGNLQERACDASEAMSSSCINTYQDSGVADHVPHCLSSNIADQLVPNCPTGGTAKSDNYGTTTGVPPNSAQMNGAHGGNANNTEHPSVSAPPGPLMEQKASTSMTHNERTRPKKVACLRNVRILPIAQIHGLEPSSQPRAWLDVVASANTSNEQKNEAMEEILLLAKDKRRAKIFLDEGILDYIIWTISRYTEKMEVIGKPTDWKFPDISPSEKTAANLAAMCCVTLGKAHCAAIHTEGDLLLMSMYERGTVPEERQVAQMLHEVPHHARVTKTNDPTIVQPSKEVFAPRQLTLFQAEELARSIKLVADGRM